MDLTNYSTKKPVQFPVDAESISDRHHLLMGNPIQNSRHVSFKDVYNFWIDFIHGNFRHIRE